MRKIVIIFLLATFTVLCRAQVKVTSNVDTARILIGGRTHLHISVEAPVGTHVTFPIYDAGKEIFPGIEVLETKGDTIDLGSAQRISCIYTLTAWEPKRYIIPAQRVLVDRHTMLAPTAVLTVTAVPVDTVQNTTMPADDVQQMPFKWADWMLVFWLSVVAVVLLGLAFCLYIRLRDKNPLWLPVKRHRNLSPYEEALLSITEIRSGRGTAGDQKIYYTLVVDVLRKYIMRRFGFKALEMTSTEVLERLRLEGVEAGTWHLDDVFRTADLVKFAKYSTPESEQELHMENVVHFIEDTKADTTTVDMAINDIDAGRIQNRSRKIMRLVIACLIILHVVLLSYIAFEIYSLVA